MNLVHILKKKKIIIMDFSLARLYWKILAISSIANASDTRSLTFANVYAKYLYKLPSELVYLLVSNFSSSTIKFTRA